MINSRTGRKMPVNAYPITHDGSNLLRIVADGNIIVCTYNVVKGQTVYEPHWLDPRCPNHKQNTGAKAPVLSGKDFASGAFSDG